MYSVFIICFSVFAICHRDFCCRIGISQNLLPAICRSITSRHTYMKKEVPAKIMPVEAVTPVPIIKNDANQINETAREVDTEQISNTARTEREDLTEGFNNEDSSENNNYGRRRSTFRPSLISVRKSALAHPTAGHIPTSEDERKFVTSAYGVNSCQLKLLYVVHSKPVQVTLMLMLLLDVLVLFAELYLQAEFPSCSIISRDAISCCSAPDDYHGSDHYEDNGHSRFLGVGGGHYGICYDPNTEEAPYQAGCDSHKYPALHTAHVALFAITIAILSCFMVELIALNICLSPCIFFSQAFYVVDFLVVFLSFALEVTFYIASKDNLGAAVGLLVVIRLWRFARIGHGLVKAATEAQSAKHKKVVQELEDLLLEHNIAFESHLEDHIKKREESLRNMGD